MKRLTYDYEGRHFCDYPTREIINRLAECEIMLEKLGQIIDDWEHDVYHTSDDALDDIERIVEEKM